MQGSITLFLLSVSQFSESQDLSHRQLRHLSNKSYDLPEGLELKLQGSGSEYGISESKQRIDVLD